MNKTRFNWLLIISISSILVAVFLIILKAWIGFKTNSISILASLIDSLTDLLASIINLIGIAIALKPADYNHNFGHAKAEGISSIIQAAFITGSAIFIIFNGFERLFYPSLIQKSNWAILVMIISIILTGLLSLFQHIVLKKNNSLSLAADTLHYTSDFFLNLSVIIALFLTQIGWNWADSILGILLGGWMLYLAGKIFRKTFVILMDESLPLEEVIKIQEVVNQTPGVIHSHDLATRTDGKTRYIQLHVEIDKEKTFVESHQITTAVVNNIKALSPKMTKVFVHADPYDAT